jgi:hypothetical protein
MRREEKAVRHSLHFRPNELGLAILLNVAIVCGVVAFSDRSTADGAKAPAMTVNQMNKGDRLALPVPSSRYSPAATGPQHRVPFGCDPAFSPVADPALAHVFLRCLS